jgi:hypothetical protein
MRWALFKKRAFERLVKNLKVCVEALKMVSQNLDLFEDEE